MNKIRCRDSEIRKCRKMEILEKRDETWLEKGLTEKSSEDDGINNGKEEREENGNCDG